MKKFANRIAIVTGGASGIGRALSEELARQGAAVVIADIQKDAAEKVAQGIAGRGGRAQAAALDVTQADAVERLVTQTVAQFGRLDYMFNNAGIGIGGDFRDLELDHWRRIFEVNFWGVLHGSRAAYRVMVKQGGGHIVNTSSLAGLVPAPMQAGYTSCKYAVVGLSQSLRTEGKDLGVKVSVVCPGMVETPILKTTEVVNAAMADLVAQIPLKFLPPAQAAQAILKGVAKNRRTIVFPCHARLIWWLEKKLPRISNLMWLKHVRDFRKLRKLK